MSCLSPVTLIKFNSSDAACSSFTVSTARATARKKHGRRVWSVPLSSLVVQELAYFA